MTAATPHFDPHHHDHRPEPGTTWRHEHCDVDSSTDDYARRFAGAAGAWMLSVQNAAVVKLASPWRGGSVLDVGGGHAQLCGPLTDAGFTVTVLGSDLACADRPHRLCPCTAFVCGDLLDLPFDDQCFDVVTAVRMLAHVERWEQMVAQLCRVARRAVIVDFATPVSVNAIAPLLFGLKKGVEKNTRAFQMQTKGRVRRAFGAAGFAHCDAVGQFAAPMALHRMLGRPGVSRAVEGVLGVVGLRSAFGSPVILRAQREHA